MGSADDLCAAGAALQFVGCHAGDPWDGDGHSLAQQSDVGWFDAKDIYGILRILLSS